MKKLLLFTIYILTSSIMLAQDNNNEKPSFEKEWKEVKKYDEEKLPQSAIKIVDNILKQAIESQNNQQVIKSLIHRNKYKTEIDPADNSLITDLHSLLNDSISISEKALLQSILAELYSNAFQNDKWNINRRSPLVGFVPSDIKEWTKNIYTDTIYSMLCSSVEQKEELKKITTKSFKDILVLGKDSKKFYPTLYDFLMKRAITISCSIEPNRWEEGFKNIEKKEERNSLTTSAKDFVKLEYDYLTKPISPFYFFRNYSLDLINRNMTPTLILTDLDRLSFVHEENNGFTIIDYNWEESIWIDELKNPDFKLEGNLYYGYLSYYKDMERLEQIYSDQPESVEIIYEIVQLLNQINNVLKPADIIYEWVQKGIKKYPDYPRTELLRNEVAKLENPSIKFKGASLFYPTKDVNIDVIHKNLQAWENNKIRVFKILDDEKCELLSELSPELVSTKTYFADTLALNLGKMECGHYLLAYGKQSAGEIENTYKEELRDKAREYYYESSSESIYQFTVSSFASFSRQKSQSEFEVYVVDRLSGKPLNNIDIDFYPYYIKEDKGGLSKEKTTIRTNKNGKAIFRSQERDGKDRYYAVAEYIISKGKDKSKPIPLENDYRFKYASDYNYTSDSIYINIFTDRSIYRPGQTVYYKAVYTNTKDRQVISNKELTVELFGDNKIAEQKKKTNEFGSISGEFVLPKIGLNGQYSLCIENTRTYFRVEEYKRPSYEITFDEITKTYKQGDEIVVKGHAKNFSGVSLQNMDVNYSISRSQHLYYWRMPTTLLDSGIVKTDQNGAFEIKFIAKFDVDKNPDFAQSIYNFTVDANVTDINGESQIAQFNIPIGVTSLKLSLNTPDKVDKNDTKPIIIEANNLNNKPISTEGEYTLYRLDENDSIQSQILNENFTANVPSDLKDRLKKVESGKYRLVITAKDDLKREVKEEKDFLLYSFSDKRPPYKTNEWLIIKNDTIGKKRDGEFVFGVTDKDVNILYQLHNNTTVFEEKFISLNNENKHFKISYKNEYGKGVQVSLTYIKDGKFLNQVITFVKEEEQIDLKLNTTLSVFRDRLRPGQEEVWTIKVTDRKDHPVNAELLASMYDVSLDKIYKGYDWHFFNYRRDNVYIDRLEYTYSFRNSLNNRIRYQLEIPYNDYELRNKLFFYFDYIDWGQNLQTLLSGKVAGLATSVELQESAVQSHEPSAYYAFEEKSKAPNGLLGLMDVDADKSVERKSNMISETPQPEIRRNFNETAFFYPQLRTNKNGETLISFTVPESLTKWNFRVLAHDKALRVGEISKMVQTQKELMVTPNMPRFLRQGDKTNISTKISNLSSGNIAGEVKIEFFDPATEEAVNIEVMNQAQKFSIAVNESTSANWTFTVPEDIEILGCRIIAQNKQFSDGEQHALVVLSNRTLITETMPIEAIKGDDNVFIFDKLRNNRSKTLENYHLTFEYTGNPIWYAVQALPALSTPDNENAVNWFASYYVNNLGMHIVKNQPKVANMISTWNKAEQSSLISKLETNEELKAILLEETPWILDAQNESEQMQRLALLFDINNSNYQTTKSLDKLKDLQTSEGGWSWYKGMKPSRSITQYILYGFAQLTKINGTEYSEDIKQMQSEALRYIDLQIIKDFEQLKKSDKNWKRKTKLSTTQMEYLYVRSFYRDIPILREALEAEKFYAGVAKKYWRLHNLYERSLLVVALSNHGDKSIAKPITRSLREYSFTSKKDGMYWPKNTSNVFMSQSAISVHTFLMEALIENGASTKEVDNMKRWLLAQKQTQQWESTHATIDAINTLISTGNDWLSGKEKNPTVKVGRGNIFDLDRMGKSGTAYVKYTWHKDEIDRSLAKVEVTQNNANPSYGALYWQYFENIDKVSAHRHRDLKVEKLLFKEEGTGKDKKLIPITLESPLKIGDRVTVRLTINTQKDMDFVQLKDMRAACFEPMNVLSGSKYKDGLFFYQTSKDASTNFFFDFIPKGTYVLEYSLVVNRIGEYSNGITTIQCAYAPEFISHTSGDIVIVK